jgi:hypothetical protein
MSIKHAEIKETMFLDLLESIDALCNFLHQVCFSDEATFHANGVVNRYNYRIWAIKIHISHVSWREAVPE